MSKQADPWCAFDPATGSPTRIEYAQTIEECILAMHELMKLANGHPDPKATRFYEYAEQVAQVIAMRCGTSIMSENQRMGDKNGVYQSPGHANRQEGEA